MVFRLTMTSCLWAGASLFILDQAIKLVVLRSQLNGESLRIGLTMHLNPHAAFSLPVPMVWFLMLSCVLLVTLLVVVITLRSSSELQYPLIFLLFAAASNLIDRFLHGAVIDYLVIGSVYFNLSDIMIMGAAGIFLWNNLVVSKAAIG